MEQSLCVVGIFIVLLLNDPYLDTKEVSSIRDCQHMKEAATEAGVPVAARSWRRLSPNTPGLTSLGPAPLP